MAELLSNRLFLIITFIFCISLSPLFPQQSPPYQALITDLQGKVQIKKAEKSTFKKAIWGTQLYTGDQLKTMDASQVTLLFNNNNLITLGANSNLTIARNQFSGNTGSIPVTNLNNGLQPDLAILSLRETEDGEVGVLAGLRSGSKKEIVLLSPRNTKIRNRHPDFIWKSDQQYERFKITLYDDNGKVWSNETTANHLKFPNEQAKLKFGGPYFWYVEGIKLFENHRSESIGFNIAEEEEFQQVEEKAGQILALFKNNPESNSYQFVLANYFQKEGFLADAIDHFKIISDKNKDAPLPHQILGNLYQKIGLTEKAISELQKAVELGESGEK